jgi:Exostosin family
VTRVLLLSAAPAEHEQAYLDLEQLRSAARLDRFAVHRVVERAEDAELILFVETSGYAGYYFERVLRHSLYRSRRADCYLFCSTDKFIPMLPGVYASVEKSWYWESWTRSSHYLGVRERGHMCYSTDHNERPYLFSFVGSTASHPVRSRLMSIGHPRALMIDRRTTPGGPPPLSREDYEWEYAQNIKQSEFVLCPRGGGTSSFRLFETMMLGRVPVIIADQWVAPRGPDWDSFSVRVKEAELDTIPHVLEERASEAAEMGERARAAWLEWFSESVSFHRIVESCLELAESASSRSGMRRYAPRLQLLRPYHSARWMAKRLGNRRMLSR